MTLTLVPCVGYAMQVVVAVLACFIARKRRFHKPFAYFAVALALADITRGLILSPVLHAITSPVTSFHGPFRILFHVDQGLTLLPRVALMLASWSMVRKGVTEHLAGASTLAWLLICVSYPSLNGHGPDGGDLQSAYLCVFTACQVATWCAMLAMFTARDSALLPTQSLMIATVSADLAVLAGPFANNIFTDWHFSAGTYLALQVTSIVVHAAWLAGLRPLKVHVTPAVKIVIAE